jgi:hypothetical protein
MRIVVPLQIAFWAKVEKRRFFECWPWLGARAGKGYGVFRGRRAARLAWELDNGLPFPPGMEACHTCDNPPCVNPGHIWPGTRSLNMLDASAKGRLSNRRNRPPGSGNQHTNKTHCIRGHEFTPENTIPRIRHDGSKHRDCRAYRALRRDTDVRTSHERRGTEA